MANQLNRFSPPPPPPNHGPFHSPDPIPPSYLAPVSPRGFYPIELGRGISLTFSLFRFAWRPLVVISLITAVPVALVSSVAGLLSYNDMAAWQQTLNLSILGQAPSTAQLAATFPWSSIALSLIGALIVGPISLIGGAALTYGIGAAVGGGAPRIRGSFAAAIHRLRDLLIVFAILIVSGVGLSLVGALFPIISALGPGGLGLSGPVLFLTLIAIVGLVFAVAFVSIRLVFTVQAVMLEGKTAGAAIRRSWNLAGGSMLRIVGWAAVFALIVGLIGLVFEIPAFVAAFAISPVHISLGSPVVFPASYLFVLTFVQLALAAVVQPLMSIGMTLLYFDTRFRRGDKVPTPGAQ